MHGEQPQVTSFCCKHFVAMFRLSSSRILFLKVFVTGQRFHQCCRACVWVEHEALVICDCFASSRQFNIDRMLALRQHVQSFIGYFVCTEQCRTAWVPSKVFVDAKSLSSTPFYCLTTVAVSTILLHGNDRASVEYCICAHWLTFSLSCFASRSVVLSSLLVL